MKKLTLSIGFLLLSISYASASSCIDLQNNFTKGEESAEVLTLQNFLFEKGLLTAEPNGYFGPMTLQSVKKYQDSASIPDNGDVLTLTRQAIKKETCDGQIYSPSNAVIRPVECIDLQNNLTMGKNTDEVLTLQNFLKQRGLLTAIPNGYFGPSTLRGVKSYQGNVGLTTSGAVLSLTRQAIKDETCAVSQTVMNTSPIATYSPITAFGFPLGCSSSNGFSPLTGISCSFKENFSNGCTSSNGFSITTGISCSKNTTIQSVQSPSIVASSTIPVISTTSATSTTPLTFNERRQNDVITLLIAMYTFYLNSGGTYPIPVIATTSVEICTLGITLCGNLNEIKSSLVPRFLSYIPMDPTLASSTGAGYFMTRTQEGVITITAPRADAKASIFASCNFNGGCKIKTASDVVVGKPYIDSIDKAIFLSGGVMSAPLVIHGNNFTSASNTVTLVLQGGRKVYTLGMFPSVDGLIITAISSFTITPFPCGVLCVETLPVGGYDVIVTTEKGDSNTGFISLQGITATSVSNGNDKPFIPKSTHMKLGTVALSSQSLVTLKSLSFTLEGTTTLLSKVTNFTITDAMTGKIINGGLNFTLPDEMISNNETKIYELYANIADIDNSYAGRIEIGGAFTVKEAISNSLVVVPIPKFMITISY